MKKATRGRKPFPPGRYPVVIIGSGPGGLQTSYALRRLRVEHAVLSADAGPGGMFLRFPLFQRLISWSKRSEEHTSELQSHSDLVCRLLLEKKKRSVTYMSSL